MTSQTASDIAVPALYAAEVGHTRREGMHRSFTHRIYLWLVDLDRLPALPAWLAPFARFDPRDHLGSPRRSIRANLDAWLATRGVDLAGGRVLMLAHARVLGYVFNPLTVYWCYRPGGALACVVAEVHNTYGERHCYLLTPDAGGRAEAGKEFYVSPFLPVDGHYDMHFSTPGPQLSVTISLRRDGATPLSATLRGTRRPATTGQLVRMLLRYPLTPLRVSALIRAHGIALWARGLPIVPRPRHAHQEGVR